MLRAHCRVELHADGSLEKGGHRKCYRADDIYMYSKGYEEFPPQRWVRNKEEEVTRDINQPKMWLLAKILTKDDITVT